MDERVESFTVLPSTRRGPLADLSPGRNVNSDDHKLKRSTPFQHGSRTLRPKPMYGDGSFVKTDDNYVEPTSRGAAKSSTCYDDNENDASTSSGSSPWVIRENFLPTSQKHRNDRHLNKGRNRSIRASPFEPVVSDRNMPTGRISPLPSSEYDAWVAQRMENRRPVSLHNEGNESSVIGNTANRLSTLIDEESQLSNGRTTQLSSTAKEGRRKGDKKIGKKRNTLLTRYLKSEASRTQSRMDVLKLIEQNRKLRVEVLALKAALHFERRTKKMLIAQSRATTRKDRCLGPGKVEPAFMSVHSNVAFVPVENSEPLPTKLDETYVDSVLESSNYMCHQTPMVTAATKVISGARMDSGSQEGQNDALSVHTSSQREEEAMDCKDAKAAFKTKDTSSIVAAHGEQGGFSFEVGGFVNVVDCDRDIADTNAGADKAYSEDEAHEVERAIEANSPHLDERRQGDHTASSSAPDDIKKADKGASHATKVETKQESHTPTTGSLAIACVSSTCEGTEVQEIFSILSEGQINSSLSSAHDNLRQAPAGTGYAEASCEAVTNGKRDVKCYVQSFHGSSADFHFDGTREVIKIKKPDHKTCSVFHVADCENEKGIELLKNEKPNYGVVCPEVNPKQKEELCSKSSNHITDRVTEGPFADIEKKPSHIDAPGKRNQTAECRTTDDVKKQNKRVPHEHLVSQGSTAKRCLESERQDISVSSKEQSDCPLLSMHAGLLLAPVGCKIGEICNESSAGHSGVSKNCTKEKQPHKGAACDGDKCFKQLEDEKLDSMNGCCGVTIGSIIESETKPQQVDAQKESQTVECCAYEVFRQQDAEMSEKASQPEDPQSPTGVAPSRCPVAETSNITFNRNDGCSDDLFERSFPPLSPVVPQSGDTAKTDMVLNQSFDSPLVNNIIPAEAVPLCVSQSNGTKTSLPGGSANCFNGLAHTESEIEPEQTRTFKVDKEAITCRRRGHGPDHSTEWDLSGEGSNMFAALSSSGKMQVEHIDDKKSSSAAEKEDVPLSPCTGQENAGKFGHSSESDVVKILPECPILSQDTIYLEPDGSSGKVGQPLQYDTLSPPSGVEEEDYRHLQGEYLNATHEKQSKNSCSELANDPSRCSIERKPGTSPNMRVTRSRLRQGQNQSTLHQTPMYRGLDGHTGKKRRGDQQSRSFVTFDSTISSPGDMVNADIRISMGGVSLGNNASREELVSAKTDSPKATSSVTGGSSKSIGESPKLRRSSRHKKNENLYSSFQAPSLKRSKRLRKK